MKKVLFRIKGDVLLFKYSNTESKDLKKLLNTNVISDEELLFSMDYITDNKKIVASFIKDLAAEQNITKIEIQSIELASLIIKVLNKIPKIDLLSILSEETITFDIAETIVNNDNVHMVSCYSAPLFIIEYMDRYGVMLESRSELFFTSNFMQINSLAQYSKIYYKKSIKIPVEMEEDDLEDFTAFCKINRYLKTIHFEACDVDKIKSICDIIKSARKKNIKILVHGNITNEKDVNVLRRINKQNKNNMKIKLVYSKEYIRDNYLKQVIFTTAKYAAMIILIIVGCSFSFIAINNHNSKKNVEGIRYTIEKTIAENTDNTEIKEEGEHGPSAIKSLLSVNEDTVGWLTVKGTSVDYPVVQTVDNSYYLRRNFDKESDYSGWIFADYQNNIETLDRNTVIYGHNRYYSDVMFGSLTNLLKKDWQEDSENYVITFNTLYKEMKFKIFSVYKIKKTDDYVKKYFKSDNEFLDFIEMIEGRSEIDFDEVISVNDKILTLSTCLQNNRRLVVHAVLLADE